MNEHDAFTAYTMFARAQGTEHVLAARLLQLGIRGPVRPVDRLIERLSHADKNAWVEDSLDDLTRSIQQPVRDLLLGPGGSGGGPAALDALKSMKDRCKRLAAKGKPGEEPLAPMLGYFFALASALAHHRTLVSSVPRGEIDGVLLDLACVLPDPWADLLCRATLVDMPVTKG
jgi:hypothetical protein